MGRRSANSTKSGKFMNPTDQARKEARRKELKKNKKQRTMVRAAVLKGKDPVRIIEELEQIDNIEFNPIAVPILNEKVLKEKRRKLVETFQRVLVMYERDHPDHLPALKQSFAEYDSRRFRMQTLYEQAKTAEKVQLCEIPLPDMPQGLPLPGEIPLPSFECSEMNSGGILKRKAIKRSRRMLKEPPGPPPGSPPDLSDDEDGATDNNNARRIRFAEADLAEETMEKDTRMTFKSNVSSLQEKMLKIAGQNIPMSSSATTNDQSGVSSSNSGSAGASDNVNSDKINSDNVNSDSAERIESRRVNTANDIEVALKRSRMHQGNADVLSDNESEEEDDLSDDDASDLSHDDSADDSEDEILVNAINMPPGAPPGAPPGLPTITAKPQLLSSNSGDITKFMPTSLKVKRIIRDARGKPIKQSATVEPVFMDLKKQSTNAMQTKDDAYDNFMKEMENIM